MFEYFAVLRVAASFGAEPASRAAAATFESANGQMTIIIIIITIIYYANCSCSLAVLDPRVGHTMDVLSPFIPVLCRSD